MHIDQVTEQLLFFLVIMRLGKHSVPALDCADVNGVSLKSTTASVNHGCMNDNICTHQHMQGTCSVEQTGIAMLLLAMSL